MELFCLKFARFVTLTLHVQWVQLKICLIQKHVIQGKILKLLQALKEEVKKQFPDQNFAYSGSVELDRNNKVR